MVRTVRSTPQLVDPADAEDTFADLQREAARIDASASAPGAPGAAPAGEAAPADPAARMAADLFALLKLPRNLAAKRFAWWPEFGQVWSDDQLHAIALSLAELCKHMGWNIDDLMGKFGPWVAVCVTVGVPCYVTWDAIQDRRELIAREQRAALKQATSAQHGDPRQPQPA